MTFNLDLMLLMIPELFLFLLSAKSVSLCNWIQRTNEICHHTASCLSQYASCVPMKQDILGLFMHDIRGPMRYKTS